MKIQIITVVVGIEKNKGWILNNFIEGIKQLIPHVDVHLNVVLGSVPQGTDWGIVGECDFEEVNTKLIQSNIPFTINYPTDFEQNPLYNQIEDPNYPSTGESHSKILDNICYHFSNNLKDDFLLIMDYDSFLDPSRIDEFIKILEFSKGNNIVFGCLEEEFKIKEIHNNSEPVDYILQSNNSSKIEKGVRSIIYLPRMHPLFILFTREALLSLVSQNLLHICPLKTIGVFDDTEYIVYGDCGVFLLNVISKETGITWILKSSLEMPVLHYKGLTLKLSKNEHNTKIELDNLFYKLYNENN